MYGTTVLTSIIILSHARGNQTESDGNEQNHDLSASETEVTNNNDKMERPILKLNLVVRSGAFIIYSDDLVHNIDINQSLPLAVLYHNCIV